MRAASRATTRAAANGSACIVYAGTDRAVEDGYVSINGTSELPMRNQFAAWHRFMLDDSGSAAGPPRRSRRTEDKLMLRDPTFDLSTEPVFRARRRGHGATRAGGAIPVS
ncbi:hypothetical protein [Burkholderia gladioli]|uniref:hypothetical protein n=1 Tax=Burkholderia gladioli TaxID=28095 RepID=UPI003D23C6CA